MMMSVRLAVPNSVILVEDALGGEIPESMNKALLTSTNSCIAIGCVAENDGETKIILKDYEDTDTGIIVFDGLLQTGSGKLVVRTVFGDILLAAPVPGGKTRLVIFVNNVIEPDCIIISVK